MAKNYIPDTISDLCGKWWNKYTHRKKAEQTAIDTYIASNRRVDRDKVIRYRTERKQMEEILLDFQTTFNFKFPKRF